MSEPKLEYTYSLFVTDEGEISTGVSGGESLRDAADWLGTVFTVEVLAALKANPNRIISFVVVTKQRYGCKDCVNLDEKDNPENTICETGKLGDECPNFGYHSSLGKAINDESI